MIWAWICFGGAAVGAVAAYFGFRHSWRELDRRAAEHEDVLYRHENHIER